MQTSSRDHLVIKRSLGNTGRIIVRKVTVRTRPTNWQGTSEPVILPFSIHSAIYEGIDGDFKVASFLQVVKSKVKGKVTILLCEGAHLQTLSLKYNNDIEKALQVCYQDAAILVNRYNLDFQGCEVVYWKDLVTKNESYNFLKDKIYNLYQTDERFRSIVKLTAEKIISDIKFEYLDKSLYTSKTELDLLEQCVYLMVVSKEGYKFEFYPGKRSDCLNFINNELLNNSTGVTRVNVTLGTPKNPEKVEGELTKETSGSYASNYEMSLQN